MNGFQEIENIYSAANFKGALVSKDHFPSFSKRDKMLIFPLLSLQMLVCWDKTASDVLISRMAGKARHSLSEYFRRQRNSPSWLFQNICLHISITNCFEVTLFHTCLFYLSGPLPIYPSQRYFVVFYRIFIVVETQCWGIDLNDSLQLFPNNWIWNKKWIFLNEYKK